MKRELVERELTEVGPRRRGGMAKRRRSVTVNLTESPISWLHARGHLDARLFEAGERLRADYERAQLSAGVTMRWEPVRIRGGGDPGLNPTERQIAAKARFDGAIAEAGKGLADILWRVVCACEPLPQAEKALDWPARSGKLVLRLALDRVADFYRLPCAAIFLPQDRVTSGPCLWPWPLAKPHLAWDETAMTDQALYDVFDAIFHGDMALDPQQATALGLDKGELAAARSRLNGVGPQAERKRFDHARNALAALRAIDPAGLSATGQLRRQVAEYMLEQRLVAEQFAVSAMGYPYRISQQNGAHCKLPDYLDSKHPVDSADDAEAYLERLSAFAGVLDEESRTSHEDAARGYLAPDWALDYAEATMGKLLAQSPEASGMTRSLAERAAAKGIAGTWAEQAAAIVENEVYPALRRQAETVRELRPASAPGDGIWRLPDGEEHYAAALAYYTTTGQSADEVHATGLAQVEELSAQLDTILRAEGLTQGSVGARLAELNNRPDQLYANDDAGRAALLAVLNEGVDSMQERLGEVMATVPEVPIVVKRVPPEIEDGASAGYYYVAALDGSRPAMYWVNLRSTHDWPRYTLPALTYHEANPGHHYHLSLVQQDRELPLLLKNYWLSAYGEGWALYAEMLADEMGAYEGIERAGALQSWLFRAARLVVDTGLHARRWTLDEATRYFADTVGFTLPRSRAEIERYCVMPGQACSYKVGQNEWVRQRMRAERALGDRFDLKRFHDLLTEGLMPLSMFDRRVGAFIEREAA
ncbi:DUF885 family protein [Tsuneonella sp. HG222]